MCSPQCVDSKPRSAGSVAFSTDSHQRWRVAQARAATNLSFIYFLEGDNGNARKYAEVAHKYDRYNAKALVNLGNVLYAEGKLEKACVGKRTAAHAFCWRRAYFHAFRALKEPLRSQHGDVPGGRGEGAASAWVAAHLPSVANWSNGHGLMAAC